MAFYRVRASLDQHAEQLFMALCRAIIVIPASKGVNTNN